MPESEFLLGALVYRRKSPKPGRELEPVLAKVRAETPHLAKRCLAMDMLQRGYFLKEIRMLPDGFSPFDEEGREIP